MSKRIIFTLFGAFCLKLAFTQDLHYSQFYYNYHNFSPSSIGNFQGDDRLTLNYRNQWLSIPVPYNTFSFLYDANRSLKNGSKIGFGIGLDYDRAGDSKLSLTKILVSVNYLYTLNNRNQLSLGFIPSFAQRRINTEGLRWDRQWNGDRYDPKISSNENFASSGDFFLDLGIGLGYQFQYTARTKFVLSGSAYHLNEPNQTFYGLSKQVAKLPLRYNGGIEVSVGIGRYFDFLIGGMYQVQEQYQEILGSARIRMRLNQTPGSVLNMLLGCNLRLEDAIVPNFGIEYKNWMISASYDINTYFIKTITNKRGGPEIALQYVFAKVRSSGIYKKCPLY